MRAALVNKSSLAEVARRLDLGKFIKLSRSELASGAHERPSILADVVEAVIGAVYTEAGFTAVYTCIGRLLGETVATVTPRDPKTELQEVMHASNGLPPVYKLECVEGPEHSPVFISVVEINGEIVGRGRGTTKKASQQAAAEQALALVLAQTNTTQGLRMVKSLENVASDSGDVVSPGATQVTQSQEEVTDE
jgi:ribonuclease-3